MANRGVN